MPSRLAKLPLLGDLWDGRAAVRSGEITAFDVLKVSLPAIAAGMLTIYDFFARALSSWPESIVYAQTCIPALLLAVCCWLIVKREVRERRTIGFADVAEPVEYVYHHSPGERIVAKVLLLPLLLLAVNEFWALIPNALSGQRYVAGFVCNSVNGAALGSGSVEALDALGRPVSKSREFLDDRGFFVIDLEPWGRAVKQLRVTAEDCGSHVLQMRDARATTMGCAVAPQVSAAAAASHTWEVSCH